MTKSSQTVTVKYVIRTRFKVEGVVEKPDAIGAVFGQTEGLFGHELDLRALQKSGRIGRIDISLASKQDETTGTITIPTSLDKVSTAIIAASLESINRVGPCEAKVTLDKIDDVRNVRRRAIIDRAKVILHEWTIKTTPGTDEIFREVSQTLRVPRVEKYGPDKIAAGPDIERAKEIIIVEGRADVINLLKSGIQNVVALEGVKIPESIKKLSREKVATAFLDGDRGGDLIFKELLQVTNVKYIARAPKGKEVEELTPQQIERALKAKIPIGKGKAPARAKPERRKRLIPKQLVKTAKELTGTLEAVLLNEKMDQIERLPVSELAEKLQGINEVDTIVFDGIITQRLVDIATEKNIKYLIAARISEAIKQSLQVKLLTFDQI